jgi:hypothetical protein
MGHSGHFGPLEDTVKPDVIATHGTKIVLSGNAEAEDTMKALEAAASPSRWIAKYLNARYFRSPEASRSALARAGNTPTDHDREPPAPRHRTRRISAGAPRRLGTVELTGALAHWWILADEPALTQNSGFVESAGHVAALYQNELYELASGRSGTAKLQQFGVLFGHRFVVLYIEPRWGRRAYHDEHRPDAALGQ